MKPHLPPSARRPVVGRRQVASAARSQSTPAGGWKGRPGSCRRRVDRRLAATASSTMPSSVVGTCTTRTPRNRRRRPSRPVGGSRRRRSRPRRRVRVKPAAPSVPAVAGDGERLVRLRRPGPSSGRTVRPAAAAGRRLGGAAAQRRRVHQRDPVRAAAGPAARRPPSRPPPGTATGRRPGSRTLGGQQREDASATSSWCARPRHGHRGTRGRGGSRASSSARSCWRGLPSTACGPGCDDPAAAPAPRWPGKTNGCRPAAAASPRTAPHRRRAPAPPSVPPGPLPPRSSRARGRPPRPRHEDVRTRLWRARATTRSRCR